jgi:hypothetical protein
MSTIAVKAGKIAVAPKRELVEKLEEHKADWYDFHERLIETVDDVETGRIAPLDLKSLRKKISFSKRMAKG